MTIGPGPTSPTTPGAAASLRAHPHPAPAPAPDTAPRVITLAVNGAPLAVTVKPYDVLLDVLRERLNLTGTKRGCDMGTCGCCTVHVEGRPRLSCLTLALDCAGKSVTTIEGLRAGAELDSLQRFFATAGGSQCGFCTPGFIMTARSLLDANPDPDEGEIREAISGNVCRCTGYVKIIEAIRLAAAAERATAPARAK